jgi:hypothetical protein
MNLLLLHLASGCYSLESLCDIIKPRRRPEAKKKMVQSKMIEGTWEELSAHADELRT